MQSNNLSLVVRCFLDSLLVLFVLDHLWARFVEFSIEYCGFDLVQDIVFESES